MKNMHSQRKINAYIPLDRQYLIKVRNKRSNETLGNKAHLTVLKHCLFEKYRRNLTDFRCFQRS